MQTIDNEKFGQFLSQLRKTNYQKSIGKAKKVMNNLGDEANKNTRDKKT